MKICENGIYRDMTKEEIAKTQQLQAEYEKQYFRSIGYEQAVDSEIRKRYSISEEFAILRQKDEKLQEYAEYYAYCEECKARIKSIIEKTDK